MYGKMHGCLCNNQRYVGNIMEIQLLTQECSYGNWGIRRNGILCECHADDASSRVAVDDITWKSHKTITQINHTNELHKMIAQDKMMSHPRMKMMNTTFRCSRATQVCMEDLRLVNLTKNVQGEGMNELKLLVNALDG